MKGKYRVTFVMGLLIGGLVGLIVWYWQKSTSAEDGALDLLDRLANAERSWREVISDSAAEPTPTTIQISTQPTNEVPSFLQRQADLKEPEDLTQIKGIGPVFQGRLYAAEIDTVAAVTAVIPAALAEILDIPESRAETILTHAKELTA
ncbi:MAG: helix-hairpin-helix domain-containing protein [Chloroflexi bacterium]|nr:helix-hairpin-helix domain-containing protein [Chloroflexota bacterium]